jgi:hypothetical protein
VAPALPALAESPAPAPSVSLPAPAARTAPNDAVRRIVEPLREIGHVKAHSPFCTDLLRAAGPATRSALAFEARLLATIDDLHDISFSDELAKARGLKKAQDDLNALADLARSGRAELHGLRPLAAASDTALHDALVSFGDALDGAKAHQLELARQLSSLYGELAEKPTYSNANNASDRRSGLSAYGWKSSMRDDATWLARAAGGPNAPQGAAAGSLGWQPSLAADADWLDTGEAQERYVRGQSLFGANDDDRRIGDDLARAGVAGRAMLALGGC